MNTRTSKPKTKDPSLELLRVPPHSIEAEQSVLGGLLLDNNAWDRIGDQVTESDFIAMNTDGFFVRSVACWKKPDQPMW